MAFNTIEELNLYALGSLQFTNDVQYYIPEGTKVQISQPTWDWVRTTGNISGNNVVVTHETIDTLAGNVTISFDDYNAATMSTNIVNTTGNVSITGLDSAEDWTGATLYLDVPADYYGNISFTSRAENTVSGEYLEWDNVINWTNEPELDTPQNFNYNWYGNYAGQWSLDFWVYNDNVAPTSSAITSYPVTMINVGGGADATANNWSEVLSYYDQDYIYPGFDQVIFDFRPVGGSQFDPGSDDKPYFILNNGPVFPVSAGGTDTGTSYRVLVDNSGVGGGGQSTSIPFRAGPGGGDPMPRGQWTHILISFDPSLLDDGGNGTWNFYRNGSWTGDDGGDPALGPALVLGKDIINGGKYFKGSIEDFRVRARTYNEYYSQPIQGQSFTPPTISTVASEGDVLLLNTSDVLELTLDDNNGSDRDKVDITTQVGTTAYTTATVKNLASLTFDGNDYIYIADAGVTPGSTGFPLLNQGAAVAGETLFTDDYIAFVRDDENDGTYTLRIQSQDANLKFRILGTENAGLGSAVIIGNQTNDITITGPRYVINSYLKYMYFVRDGEVAENKRAGTFTWTLTPPGGRVVTVKTNTYTPIYNTGITASERLYMPTSTGIGQLSTLAYAGVDLSANPVFNYTVFDPLFIGGHLTSTNHKINYITGAVTAGGVEIITLPDVMSDGPGRVATVGPRQHLNLGNAINTGSQVTFIASALGNYIGNVFQGNYTVDCNNLAIGNQSVQVISDASNDGTDYVYITQTPYGVADTWSEGPWTYTKHISPVEAYASPVIDLTEPRQDHTLLAGMYGYTNDDYSGTYTSPRSWLTYQNLDSDSTATGGKRKFVTVKKTHTFGGGTQDQVSLEVRGGLSGRVEDDSDLDTEYVTNVVDNPSGQYLFNDTATDQYLTIKDDRFTKPAVPYTDVTVDSAEYEGLYIPAGDDFNIGVYATLSSPQIGSDVILSNSTGPSVSNTDFHIRQTTTSSGGSPNAPQFVVYIGTPSGLLSITTTAGYSYNTQYKINVIRTSGVIKLYINDSLISGTISYTGAIGNLSSPVWYANHYPDNASYNLNGVVENLLVIVEGNFIFQWSIGSLNFDTYLDLDLQFAFRIKFNDIDTDQYVLSNMVDPSATLSSGDFRLTYDSVWNTLNLDVYGVTSASGGTINLGTYYDVVVKRVFNVWQVTIDTQVSATVTASGAIGSAADTTLYFGNYTSSTGKLDAYLDSFSATDDTGLITSTGFTSLGYASKFGDTYTLDRTYFGDCLGAYAVVYGGSDSRAYLLYTKAVYTDGTENSIELDLSRGLFYRKLIINDDLSISVGSEVTIVPYVDSPSYGWCIAADAIRLGANVFINIIIANKTDIGKAYTHSLKFAYS